MSMPRYWWVGPLATASAGAAVAAALLVMNHWQIVAAPTAVLRLNQWTGTVAICALTEDPEGRSRVGLELRCFR